MEATERKYPIAEEILSKEILERREHGLKKYGVGVERMDLSKREWLEHAKEEAMDLAVYLQRLIIRQANEETESVNHLCRALNKSRKRCAIYSWQMDGFNYRVTVEVIDV